MSQEQTPGCRTAAEVAASLGVPVDRLLDARRYQGDFHAAAERRAEFCANLNINPAYLPLSHFEAIEAAVQERRAATEQQTKTQPPDGLTPEQRRADLANLLGVRPEYMPPLKEDQNDAKP